MKIKRTIYRENKRKNQDLTLGKIYFYGKNKKKAR